MTTTFWLLVSQTVVFLAVCGFAWWASNLVLEAVENSTLAAQQAAKAADDAARIATDIQQMRALLQRSLEEQQSLAEQLLDLSRQAHVGRVHEQLRTDTAEAHAVITPEAITAHADSIDSAASSFGAISRSGRHRHAHETDPRWTAALRAIASRTASRDNSQDA